MVPRENKNNDYVKFGGTNKEYYGIFQNGLFGSLSKDDGSGNDDPREQ